MFISESYIHYQDDFSHTAGYDVDEFVDISFDLHPLRRNSDAGLKSKYLSKSADLVYRSRISSNTPGYDADTDSDSNEPSSTDPASIHARCNICNLDFVHGILENTNGKIFATKRGRSRKRRERRKSLNYGTQSNNRTLQLVDFDKYKDENHRMEVFAPDSERKWTLQYEYNRERDQKTLAKVIIGRGQNDDYPELNNIHLIDELKDFKLYKWRDSCLDLLKTRNELMKDQYSLMPQVNTCLFCFNERNKDILKNIAHQSPYAFSLPSSMISEIKDINLNEDVLDGPNLLSQNIRTSLKSELNGLDSPIDEPLKKEKRYIFSAKSKKVTNATEKRKKTSGKEVKLMRTGYFSDKLFKTFTKKKVNIDLNEDNSPPEGVGELSLSDAVNIVLMYPEKKPLDDANELSDATVKAPPAVGGEENLFVVEQNGTQPEAKEKRVVRRNVNNQVFAIERGTSIEDDDDESFVIM